eukprot:gnl/TRDRNA2_/TRDRNA2_88495_c0_seq1.p1 gnl/TRDRNA2_/TRDRNA2_88495_c0~~gnl/TRDRNA2_/TRDRNA2_88495_c0_seq1.p1  ORF type:complete len:347 (+),score=31.64 gnl/TRDRNA2_/TRDRNA2_88495_c0_seq1:136-1176(+)
MAYTDPMNRKVLCWDGRAPGAIGDISRGELRSLLLERFREAGGIVCYGAKVANVTCTQEGVVVHLAEHSGDIRGRLLVGADGCYSAVRKCTVGACLRSDHSIVNVRGRCKNRGQLSDFVRARPVRFLIIAHSNGSAFFVSFYHGAIVWIAILTKWSSGGEKGHGSCGLQGNAAEHWRPSQSDVLRQMDLHGHWHPIIRELVAEAEDFNAEPSISVDVGECRQRLLSEPVGRVVLISDALHALGGGGGAWAIKDGAAIATIILEGVNDPIYGPSDLAAAIPKLREFELGTADVAVWLDEARRRRLRPGLWAAFLFDTVFCALPSWMIGWLLRAASRWLLNESEVALL